MSEHSSRPVVKKQPSFSIPRADEAMTCCCAGHRPTNSIGTDDGDKTWNIRYIFLLLVFSAVWWLLYQGISPFANWLVYKLLSLEASSQGGAALAFFLYDTAKILLLLVALIYGIGWLRASFVLQCQRHRPGHGKSLAQGLTVGDHTGLLHEFRGCKHPGVHHAAPHHDFQVTSSVHRVPVGGIHTGRLALQQSANISALSLLYGGMLRILAVVIV